MKLSDFDYNLPEELIAQEPVNPRDASRLLVYNSKKKEIEHKVFSDILDYLNEDDVLFVNNSKVFNARLHGFKETGAKIELFLLKVKDRQKNIWECLLKGRNMLSKKITFENNIEAEVVGLEDGKFDVVFNIPYDVFIDEINEIGETPLPPYIKKRKEDNNLTYQTVYAKEDKVGSSAAPTAGLHFTDELLRKAEEKGIEIMEASLHVGLGTFLPIKVENVLEHKIHTEEVEISEETINNLIRAKNSGKRIVAVGTTSCRILESLHQFLQYDKNSCKYLKYEKGDLSFSTDIFIYPGYEFKIIDSLITNFHLPKSSLLLLVSALISRDEVLNIYKEAVSEGYRFFSYGDAMLIV
ncbi:MAG: tRNA preQ1(34) S-adenosylmethionine ribosyltransferase-isomerase QueA [Patescibacteria group bacterium]